MNKVIYTLRFESDWLEKVTSIIWKREMSKSNYSQIRQNSLVTKNCKNRQTDIYYDERTELAKDKTIKYIHVNASLLRYIQKIISNLNR